MPFDKPFPDAGLESEAQEYAASYKCPIDTARRDVRDAYGDISTTADAFYERSELT